MVGGQSPNSSLIPYGIIYAVNRGAKIINLSLSVNQSASIDSALSYAASQGVLIIACSGNFLDDTSVNYPVWYPANNPNVMAISGIEKGGYRFPSRSTPAGTVSICAPAGTAHNLPRPDSLQIVSTAPGNTYSYNSGTSFSSPIVGAVAGLLLSLRSTLTPSQLRCILEKSADDLGATGYDQYYGWGRVNAYNALRAIQMLLAAPANNSTISTLTPTLGWTQIFGAPSYRVQVATNSSFTNLVYDQSGITSTTWTTPSLDYETSYYWRVRPVNDPCDVAVWSMIWQFTTPEEDSEPPDPTKIGVNPVPIKRFTWGLVQNYPNPFNPLTLIRYELERESAVTIKVFNVMGQEVETLVDATRPAGKYEVQWDGSKFASGIYTYRISAGNFTEVKRMILTK